jgi:hypothetical protein
MNKHFWRVGGKSRMITVLMISSFYDTICWFLRPENGVIYLISPQGTFLLVLLLELVCAFSHGVVLSLEGPIQNAIVLPPPQVLSPVLFYGERIDCN